MRTLLLFFLSIFIFGMSTGAFAGGPGIDPRCAGLSGAAFELCRTAIVAGCDDPETTNSVCDQLGENFSQITGEAPPWELLSSVDPSDPYYDRFEGSTLYELSIQDNSCISDSDCITGDCSGGVCTGESIFTTSEELQNLPDEDCVCVGGSGSWFLCY